MNETVKRMLMRRATGRRDHGDRDGHSDGRMTVHVMTADELDRWAEHMKNADGSTGAHFTKPEVKRAAEQLGLDAHTIGLDELWLAANMMYSDYSKALEPFCPPVKEEEAKLYTHMGKAFLCDPDTALEGGEKLGVYFRCIVE